MHLWKRKRKVSDFTVCLSLTKTQTITHYSTYRFYLHRRNSHSCLSPTVNSLVLGFFFLFYFLLFGFISNFTVYNMNGILENDVSLYPRFCDALSDLISVLFIKFSFFYSLFNHIFIFIIYLIILIVFF